MRAAENYVKHEMAKSSENQSTKIQKGGIFNYFFHGKFSGQNKTSGFLKTKVFIHHFIGFQDFLPAWVFIHLWFEINFRTFIQLILTLKNQK